MTTATLDWYGCATFRLLTPEGMTVMLDAFLDRVPSADQSSVGVDDLAPTLTKGSWILVGHSHFDHLYGAERLGAHGATIIGSYETVRVMADNGIPEHQLLAVAGGERIKLDDHTTVRVLPSLHSCSWAPDPMPPTGQVCLGDLDVDWRTRREHLQGFFDAQKPTLGDVATAALQASDQHARGDGGALTYVIETSQGSLLFADTSGAWTGVLEGISPDVAILATAGRANRNGEPVQGSLADFVVDQALTVNAKRVIPAHHDNWLPGFTHQVDINPIRECFSQRASHIDFREIGYASQFPLFESLAQGDPTPAPAPS